MKFSIQYIVGINFKKIASECICLCEITSHNRCRKRSQDSQHKIILKWTFQYHAPPKVGHRNQLPYIITLAKKKIKKYTDKNSKLYKQKILLSISNKNPESGGISSFPVSKQSDTTFPAPQVLFIPVWYHVAASLSCCPFHGISCRTEKITLNLFSGPHSVTISKWGYNLWIREGIACNFCWFFSLSIPLPFQNTLINFISCAYQPFSAWSTLCALCNWEYIYLFIVFSTKPSTTRACFLIKAQIAQ